ncbi:terminase small subunit protein [Candidatus Phyllobacterium onerii]|uniref:terminase small subunit-like protein n=1 Tax=Candidatus Phyllobacterium onerii TaxID=3020828 RepID=UPI00232EF338|nr:terminase small subunit protein [Phyllobacterium sp. IY22]
MVRTKEPGKRPLEFKQPTADIICERIACGQSVREICLDENMPAMSTVFKWLSRVEAFAEQYARARDAQADTLFDEILTIADDGSNDFMERKDGEGGTLGWKENGEAIRRSQLRVDARKWMAGKLRPKKYGEKLDIEHSGMVVTIAKEDSAL